MNRQVDSFPDLRLLAAPRLAFAQAAGPSQQQPPAYRAPTEGPSSGRNGAVGPIVVGLVLIVIGGFFLARQFIPVLNFNLIWPVIAAVAGVLLVIAAFVTPDRPR